MEITYITTISLTWLIYTFLISDIDKQIMDVLNRLKFALSINPTNHHVDLNLLQAHGLMGIPEIIDYGTAMPSNNSGSNIINQFKKRYKVVEGFKMTLMWNLFALSVHAVIYSILCFSNILLLQTHIIFSLFLGIIFYWYTQKELSTLTFSKLSIEK